VLLKEVIVTKVASSAARTRALEPEVSERVGDNIMRIREAKGLSRHQLSMMLHDNGFDISEAVLKNMEIGYSESKPRWIVVEELVALAKTLRVTVDELLF
jgi:ribosome-binding protein aMBF1 (putative translation factor)